MRIDCVEFCKALADDTRQQILVMLQTGEKCVSDISHHLSILKRLDLVTSRKEGKLVFYALNQDNVVECCGQLIAKFDALDVCET
jgi:DNA-binding transcriptional ArsR family regulator